MPAPTDRAAPASALPDAAAALEAPKRITLRVTTANGIETRRRAGLVFGRHATTVHVTPEQAEAIRKDDGLISLSVGDGGDVAMSDELANAIAEADKYKAETLRLRAHLNAAIDQMTTHGLEFVPPPVGAGGVEIEPDVEFAAPGGDGLGAPKGARMPRGPRADSARAAAVRLPLDGPVPGDKSKG